MVEKEMNLYQVSQAINGKIEFEPDVEHTYTCAFASDLMSDVLRFHMENTILITGLSNVQTLRTAEMSNVHCIVFARDKRVTEEMLELAKENHIGIITAPSSVFEISGKLYKNGIKPVY